MVNLFKNLILLLILLVSIFSCKKDIDTPVEESPINPVFEHYIDTFLEEALARGFDYNDSLRHKVTIDFDDNGLIETEESLASCFHIDNKILISREDWNSLDSTLKELLIFHELGHCLFDWRYHVPDVLTPGNRFFECVSLMNPIIYGENCIIDYYSPMWRKHYLDEFFGIAEIPDWILVGVDYNLPNDALIDSTVYHTFLNVVDLNKENDFQIEIFFNKKSTIELEMGKKKFNYDFIIQDSIFHDREISLELNNQRFLYHKKWSTTDLNSQLKLTFRVINGYFYFFLDEQFVHSREFLMESIDKINLLEDTNQAFEKVVVSEIQ